MKEIYSVVPNIGENATIFSMMDSEQLPKELGSERAASIVDIMARNAIESWSEGKTAFGVITGEFAERAKIDEAFKEQLVKWAEELKDKTKKLETIDTMRDLAADWVLRDLSDEPQGYEYIGGIQARFERLMDKQEIEETIQSIKGKFEEILPRRKVANALVLVVMLFSACTPKPETPKTPTTESTKPVATLVVEKTPSVAITPSGTFVHPLTETIEVSTETVTPAPSKTATEVPTLTSTEIPAYQYPEYPARKEVWDGEVQVWLNPEYSLGGTIRLTDEAKERVTKFIIDSLDRNSRFNGDAAYIRQMLSAQNGRLPELGIPFQNPVDNGNPRVEFGQFGRIDLNLPIEFRIYKVGVDDLSEIDTSVAIYPNIAKPDEAFLITFAPDGHMIIIQIWDGQIGAGRDTSEQLDYSARIMISATFGFQVGVQGDHSAFLSALQRDYASDVRLFSWFENYDQNAID